MKKHVSTINRQIIDGEYFSGGKREIVIGNKLAEKLDVTLGDKVVAMSNTPSGTIGSEVFRVVGIYKTFSSEFDKAFIYIPMKTAQEMLNIDDKIYEFAIVTKDYHKVEQVKNSINEELNKNFEVLSYKDLLPFLVYQIDLSKESMWIFNLIIELALIFGIINVMLMAVFERINEIGVLMAIGMKNIKIFTMILLEGLIIGIIGTVIGLGLGYLIMLPLQKIGLNLAIYTESLESFGVGAVIYPTITIEDVLGVLIAIPFISIVGAIYPAYKAIKLGSRLRNKVCIKTKNYFNWKNKMEILKTENLEKIYDDNGVPVHALKGIDLTINKGDYLVIAGPSGSGKTTLLNLLGALDTPSEGKILFEGNRPCKKKSEGTFRIQA